MFHVKHLPKRGFGAKNECFWRGLWSGGLGCVAMNRYAKTVKGVQVGRGVYKLGKLMGVSIELNGMVDLYTIRRDLYMVYSY